MKSELEGVAIMSVISCLASELSKAGQLDLGALIENIQGTVVAHRNRGNKDLAQRIHLFSEYLMKTVRDAPATPPKPGQPPPGGGPQR